MGHKEALGHGCRGRKAQSELWDSWSAMAQGSLGLRRGWGCGVVRLLDIQAAESPSGNGVGRGKGA